MKTFSIPQLFENAVSHQDGTVRKWTNKSFEARNIHDQELIITTMFNALPGDFVIKRGVSVNNRVWFEIWTPLRFNGPIVYHFDLGPQEVRM